MMSSAPSRIVRAAETVSVTATTCTATAYLHCFIHALCHWGLCSSQAYAADAHTALNRIPCCTTTCPQRGTPKAAVCIPQLLLQLPDLLIPVDMPHNAGMCLVRFELVCSCMRLLHGANHMQAKKHLVLGNDDGTWSTT